MIELVPPFGFDVRAVHIEHFLELHVRLAHLVFGLHVERVDESRGAADAGKHPPIPIERARIERA